MASESVTLTNDSTAFEPFVAVMMDVCHRLIAEIPVAFVELVEVARDPAHVIFGDLKTVLVTRRLLDADGKMHDGIRDILLSAVKGDGFAMVIVDPIKRSDLKRDALVMELARECGFETLETRNSDQLDFRDVAVSSMKSVLEKAYAAGYAAALDKIF